MPASERHASFVASRANRRGLITPATRYECPHSNRKSSKRTPGSQLPHPLREFELAKLPRIQQALLAQIDVLHGRDILRRRFADATRDDDGVRLEDDAVVDDLVDREGEDVVVFNQGSFIGGVPAGRKEKIGMR